MIALPPRPAAVRSVAADIEELAQGLATTDPAEVEAIVAAHVAAAIRERRIDDAVRWQRVRLRARSIRHRRADETG